MGPCEQCPVHRIELLPGVEDDVDLARALGHVGGVAVAVGEAETAVLGKSRIPAGDGRIEGGNRLDR